MSRPANDGSKARRGLGRWFINGLYDAAGGGRISTVNSSQLQTERQSRNSCFDGVRIRRMLPLAGIVLLFIVLSLTGITWGLPSRKIDRFLFGDGKEWSGEKIFALAGGREKLADQARLRTGADVDVDPLSMAEDVVHVTATEADIARIYLRFRLYTYQPDEMITMMALAGMNPRRLQLDPRLYQYGGLFIYPVGALLTLGDVLGLVDVRSDVAFYLDHPDEFGKFYVAARGYVAAWGALGVLVVYGVGRRVAGASLRPPSSLETTGGAQWAGNAHFAGLFAALLYTLLPVVICMSHEGKPHLPGAVLMLAAVWFGLGVVESRHEGDWTWKSRTGRRYLAMCVCCGAAVGMVLSSWPIFVLVPLIAFYTIAKGNRAKNQKHAVTCFLEGTLKGVAIAIFVYLLTNPYIAINLVCNREVLRSNFGNSLAMYEVSRVGEGLARVFQLTVEGARYPVIILGLVGLGAGLLQRHGSRNPQILILSIPAALFFIQFVLIGAGKPGEYGRFGVFPDTTLAIGAGCVMAVRLERPQTMAMKIVRVLIIARVVMFGAGYLRGFCWDAFGQGSRIVLAKIIQESYIKTNNVNRELILEAEPAPYNCPPADFSRIQVIVNRRMKGQQELDDGGGSRRVMLRVLDLGDEHVRATVPDGSERNIWSGWLYRRTPISWANKPFTLIEGKGTRLD